MTSSKLRTTIIFVIAVQIALVLASGAAAGNGEKKGKNDATTTAVQPGFHRGG
jgi:hypothetical protein